MSANTTEAGSGVALGRLIAGYACLHACMSGTRLAAPVFVLRQGYSEAQVGVLLALFALAPLVLALPAGRLADRQGVRRPLTFSVVAAVLALVLAAIVPTYMTLCVAATITGGATGASMIAVQRYVGRAARDVMELKRVFSWMSLGPAIATFAGPFIAGVLIDHGGFRVCFAVLALLPIGCWWCARDVRELHRPSGSASSGSIRSSARELLSLKPFRSLLVINWLVASCWDLHSFIVPVLGHERNLSASAVGAILGGFGVAVAGVRVLIPVIASRLEEWTVVSGAMIATALLYGVYPFMPGPIGMAICSVLLGSALGCVQPMIMSALHQITPEHRHGEAVALRVMSINASSVATPMIFGAAGTLVGIAAVFWAVAIAVGLGARRAFVMGREARGLSGHDRP